MARLAWRMAWCRRASCSASAAAASVSARACADVFRPCPGAGTACSQLRSQLMLGWRYPRCRGVIVRLLTRSGRSDQTLCLWLSVDSVDRDPAARGVAAFRPSQWERVGCSDLLRPARCDRRRRLGTDAPSTCSPRRAAFHSVPSAGAEFVVTLAISITFLLPRPRPGRLIVGLLIALLSRPDAALLVKQCGTAVSARRTWY